MRGKSATQDRDTVCEADGARPPVSGFLGSAQWGGVAGRGTAAKRDAPAPRRRARVPIL